MGKTAIRAKARPEDIVQQQIVAHLTKVCRKLGIAFFSVPNESAMKGGDNKSKHALVQWLKGMGMIAGAQDIVILYKGGHAALLEVKSATGKQTPSQMEYETWVRRTDTPYFLVRSVEDVVTVFRVLGIIEK